MPKRSTLRRSTLADKVRKRNHKMPTPCGFCRRASEKCLVDVSSGPCARCISMGIKCDLIVSEADWKRVEQEREKLKSQLENTVEELLAAKESLRALLSRQLRLLKQLRLLDRREKEMTARELASIEELEKLEQEDAQHANSSSNTTVDPSTAVDSSSVDIFAPLSPSVLASLGAFDGTGLSLSPYLN
ncbi:MAG: hypothetical protein M1823_006292 [Watsoniomyces obsoletus]|nr:MAG: hypothetical protein M1823_006292 [Watsoniomyces obsoletus]